MKTLDVILNFLIFIITAVIVFRFSRKDGRWAPDKARIAFRFFTCQSNALCAAVSLLAALAQLSGELPRWAWTLKYIGTASVAVTMFTVFLYLWPLIGKEGPKHLLSGPDCFMHLVTPLLAVLSFCLLEKQGMSFPECLWGMLPVALYGPHYLYRIRLAPEGKRWEDFYSFNQGGKWPLSFAMMFAGTFLLCLLFLLAQNA